MTPADRGARERETKTGRLCRLAHSHGLGGILLGTPPNVAWATGGASTRIDITRDTGAGTLLVGADGRRWLLASTIEAPRLVTDVLLDDAELVEYAWTDERADPGWLPALARRVLGGAGVGADWAVPGAQLVDQDVARARVPLTREEIDRYRLLGRDAGSAVGAVCRSLTRGLDEIAVAARVASALLTSNIRPIVLLVGADHRLDHFRHPVPTTNLWRDRLGVSICAERQGLVVALTRLVALEPVDRERVQRQRAVAQVFNTLVAATRAGVSGSDLFARAVATYAGAGLSGEADRHHQGGAIGYRSREWIAHPRSGEIVTPPQAFAWNPTAPGVKVEDTVIVHSDGTTEVITASPDWPMHEGTADWFIY